MAWDSSRSPYAQILNTNHLPSHAQRKEIETFLSEPQQELSRLETEISRVQVILDDLQSQRAEVKSYVETHRGLLAPIRRLPVEVLTEIFVLCLSTERYPVRSLREAPLLLTMICRHWREVTLLEFVAYLSSSGFDKRSCYTPGASASRIHHELESLDVDTKYSSLLEMLMRFNLRVAEFTLNLDPPVFPLLQKFLPQNFPNLRSLSLHPSGFSYTDRHDPFARQCASLLPGMLSLRKLSIAGTRDQSRLLDCIWANLTDLTLHSSTDDCLDSDDDCLDSDDDCLDSDDVHRVLGHTTRLESCYFSVTLKSARAASRPNLQLNCLRSLRIDLDVGDEEEILFDEELNQLFHPMICPSLASLYIHWREIMDWSLTGSDDEEIPFAGLLPSLSTLHLRFPMDCDMLTQCLVLAPNLTVLEVIDVGYGLVDERQHIVDNSHLSNLCPHSTPEFGLCPNLKTFRLVQVFTNRGDLETTGGGVSDQGLVDFLEHKCRDDLPGKTSRLESCDVLVLHPFSDHAVDKMRMLVPQNGMKLCIRYCKAVEDSGLYDDAAGGMDYLPDMSTDWEACVKYELEDEEVVLRSTLTTII
ncbi:hypothetical protein EV359DRAFT_86111 [Lentinula novae-zelandiae]|nr:hypothetical protein EV359DRAFT_86111 [Lentinula novae-zelandiae]